VSKPDPKWTQGQIQINSNQVLEVNQEVAQIWNSKFSSWVDLSSKRKHELLVQIASNLKKIQSNSTKFYWIPNPRASMIFYSNSIPNFEKFQ
jgi:hypothetical protein